MKTKISIYIAVLMLAMASCLENEIDKKFEDIELRDASLALPLGTAKIKIGELIEDIEFDDPDIELIKKGNVYAIKYTLTLDDIDIDEIDDFTDIPDITFSDKFTFGDTNDWVEVPPNFPVPERTYRLEDLIDGSFEFESLSLSDDDDDDTYISSAILSAGEIVLKFVGPSIIDWWEVTFIIHNLEDEDGNYFEETVWSDSPVIEERFPLAGYKVVGSADPDEPYTGEYRIDAEITTASTPGGDFDIVIELVNVELSELTGYIGQHEYKPDEPMEFDFPLNQVFEDLDIDGTFGIQDIEIEIPIINYMGVPVQITGAVILTDDNGMNPIVIAEIDDIIPAADHYPYPNIPPTPRNIQVTVNPIEFSKVHTKMTFDYALEVNPYEPDDPEFKPNVIRLDPMDTFEIGDVTIIVPFTFKMDFSYNIEPLDFDYRDFVSGFSPESDPQKYHKGIDHLAMYFDVDAKLPIELNLEIEGIGALNDTPVKVGTLTIASGSHEIRITKTILDQLWDRNVKQLKLTASAKTPGSDAASITTDDYFNISVSVSCKMPIPLSF